MKTWLGAHWDTPRARARDSCAVSLWHRGSKADSATIRDPKHRVASSGFSIRCPLATPCGIARSRPTVPLLCRPERRRRRLEGVCGSAPPRS